MITLLKNLEIFFHTKKRLAISLLQSQATFFLSSVFELSGILLLGPLIFIASSGELSLENNTISFIYSFLDFSSFNTFFLFFFLLTISLIIIGALSSIFSVTLVSKISTKSGVTLGDKLLEHYLSQKWAYLNNISSSKVINEIYQESARVTENIFVPMMMISKSIILCIFILLGLLYVDVLLTLLFFIFLSTVYIALYILFRARLYKNSSILTKAHEQRLNLLDNIFDIMKQIKIWGNASYFQENFHNASLKWGESYRKNLNIALLPRYFVEACILIASAIVIYYSALPGVELIDSVAKISIFLFSAFKLLPAIQSLYYSSSQIRGNLYALESIISTLSDQSATLQAERNGSTKVNDLPKLENIALQNINFTYPENKSPTLHNINAQFSKNNIYGLTGPSGSGKSTFCDILMGLLPYKDGEITINGSTISIYENRNWFKMVSYSPPDAKLIDDTTMNNIYYNASSNNVNNLEFLDSIINLDFLNLHDLDTKMNVNSFSAGQVQRIDLARTFARKSPQIIILDEPTASLDSINTKNFISELHNLKQDKIIILITHELDLLKMVDGILVFNNGYLESYPDFITAKKSSDTLNQLLNSEINN